MGRIEIHGGPEALSGAHEALPPMAERPMGATAAMAHGAPI